MLASLIGVSAAASGGTYERYEKVVSRTGSNFGQLLDGGRRAVCCAWLALTSPVSLFHFSYSLEGLTADGDAEEPVPPVSRPRDPGTSSQLDSEDRGSLISLTEEEQESYLGDCSSLDSQVKALCAASAISHLSGAFPVQLMDDVFPVAELDGHPTCDAERHVHDSAPDQIRVHAGH